MAVSKIEVSVPLPPEEVFRRMSDHTNMKDVINEITTSELICPSTQSEDKNGLGAQRKICFNGDLLTEEVVNWIPPQGSSLSAPIGYDYKVIAGKKVIADHLGVLRISPDGQGGSHIDWTINLKIALWATGEIAAWFVCRAMQKELTHSLEQNLR